MSKRATPREVGIGMLRMGAEDLIEQADGFIWLASGHEYFRQVTPGVGKVWILPQGLPITPLSLIELIQTSQCVPEVVVRRPHRQVAGE